MGIETHSEFSAYIFHIQSKLSVRKALTEILMSSTHATLEHNPNLHTQLTSATTSTFHQLY